MKWIGGRSRAKSWALFGGIVLVATISACDDDESPTAPNDTSQPREIELIVLPDSAEVDTFVFSEFFDIVETRWGRYGWSVMYRDDTPAIRRYRYASSEPSLIRPEAEIVSMASWNADSRLWIGCTADGCLVWGAYSHTGLDTIPQEQLRSWFPGIVKVGNPPDWPRVKCLGVWEGNFSYQLRVVAQVSGVRRVLRLRGTTQYRGLALIDWFTAYPVEHDLFSLHSLIERRDETVVYGTISEVQWRTQSGALTGVTPFRYYDSPVGDVSGVAAPSVVVTPNSQVLVPQHPNFGRWILELSPDTSLVAVIEIEGMRQIIDMCWIEGGKLAVVATSSDSPDTAHVFMYDTDDLPARWWASWAKP